MQLIVESAQSVPGCVETISFRFFWVRALHVKEQCLVVRNVLQDGR